MTPSRLTTIGAALWGARWTADAADLLGVSNHTLRRWSAGTMTIPDAVGDELDREIRDRIELLQKLLKQEA